MAKSKSFLIVLALKLVSQSSLFCKHCVFLFWHFSLNPWLHSGHLTAPTDICRLSNLFLVYCQNDLILISLEECWGTRTFAIRVGHVCVCRSNIDGEPETQNTPLWHSCKLKIAHILLLQLLVVANRSLKVKFLVDKTWYYCKPHHLLNLLINLFALS